MKYNVIGLMSGTSLDGLDIAFCSFSFQDKQWNYAIREAITVPYSSEWKKKLANAKQLSGLELALLDVELGKYIGEQTNKFIKSAQLSVDFIASHGHTIHHLPQHQLTTQIGSGAIISTQTNLPTICDFRTSDMALGGQGAPLVPIGDQLLFKEYDACLNLGGFSNISFLQKEKRVAFDICPVNIVLNFLCEKINLPYDDKGEIARKGQLIPHLLTQLNQLDFYALSPPKSLGIEWVERNIFPLLLEKHKIEDLITTFTHHIALQIALVIEQNQTKSILITGGGAYNAYLIQLIQKQINGKINIPNKQLVEFKEALIFAFLGVLRWENQPNCLGSVTGAYKNAVGGAIYTVLY